MVDSVLDAYRPGSWLDQAFGVGHSLADGACLRLIGREAQRWGARSEIVGRVFDNHRRLLLRYEDLLADTAATLRGIYSWLGLAPPSDLQDRLHSRTFDGLPGMAKGPGKFHRAATPGLWREHLSADEQEYCVDVMRPMLARLGYSLDMARS